jgi:cytochrome c oxidase cbb3-type subunit 3
MRKATRKATRTLGAALLLALVSLAAVLSAGRAQTPAGGPEAELGARLYAENCAVCHGADGQGRVGATLAKDWPSIRPDLTVKTIISDGVPGSRMPAWSQARGGPFNEAEIEALTQYILSWQTGGAPQITSRATATLRPPITPPPNVSGDPNRGAVLFDENCAVCHGPDGQGRVGAALAKAWSGARPDLLVKTTIANGIQGSQMPAWSQAKGGPLSDQQIDDLVVFVLTLGAQKPVEQIAPTAALPASGASQSPLSDWRGLLLFVILLVAIIGAALLLQRRKV